MGWKRKSGTKPSSLPFFSNVEFDPYYCWNFRDRRIWWSSLSYSPPDITPVTFQHRGPQPQFWMSKKAKDSIMDMATGKYCALIVAEQGLNLPEKNIGCRIKLISYLQKYGCQVQCI